MEETNNENIKAEDAKIDNDSTEEGEITDEEGELYTSDRLK
jgi:hypothetical protein